MNTTCTPADRRTTHGNAMGNLRSRRDWSGSRNVEVIWNGASPGTGTGHFSLRSRRRRYFRDDLKEVGTAMNANRCSPPWNGSTVRFARWRGEAAGIHLPSLAADVLDSPSLHMLQHVCCLGFAGYRWGSICLAKVSDQIA